MSSEHVQAERILAAPMERVFAVLRDPTQHAAIDGTGWVRDAVDAQPLTEPGQRFRVGMFHDQHPEGHYEMINEVLELQAPYAISWRPGYAPEGGEAVFEGWVWRYDLAEVGPGRTRVVLGYDWSQVGPGPREELEFPPFPLRHLDDSLAHLGELAGA